MRNSLYTNTGNIGSIIGLVVVTVLVSYASIHATEIVNGAFRAINNGVKYADCNIIQKKKKQYAVCVRDFDGNLYDTGKRIWK